MAPKSYVDLNDSDRLDSKMTFTQKFSFMELTWCAELNSSIRILLDLFFQFHLTIKNYSTSEVNKMSVTIPELPV